MVLLLLNPIPLLLSLPLFLALLIASNKTDRPNDLYAVIPLRSSALECPLPRLQTLDFAISYAAACLLSLPIFYSVA